MQQAQVVIITGASSGIGHGLAQCYAKDGWRIAIVARRLPELEQLKDTLLALGAPDVFVCACDVAQKEQVAAVFSDIIQHFGQVDCLVANAGVSVPTPAYDCKIERLESTININVLGAAYCANAVIPTMMAQKQGHIVGISSLAGYRGLPEAGAYSASKAALNALFESMRLDLKKFDIKVSVIRPGFIQTPLTDRNDYYMPFLQPAEVGVRKIYRAIRRGRAIMAFPRPLSWVVQSFYFWPVWLYDLVFAGMEKRKRDR
jgi:short-subunit dehydrogenase